jgi:predicted DNA-binding transcriptional regulator AlpA
MSSDYERRLLSTTEAARYCASSASTFEKLRVFGGGPVFVKIGRRVAYRLEDLDAWIDANRRKSTSRGLAHA